MPDYPCPLLVRIKWFHKARPTYWMLKPVKESLVEDDTNVNVHSVWSVKDTRIMAVQ